jgi:hypothetical protein
VAALAPDVAKRGLTPTGPLQKGGQRRAAPVSARPTAWAKSHTITGLLRRA